MPLITFPLRCAVDEMTREHAVLFEGLPVFRPKHRIPGCFHLVKVIP